MKHNRNYHFAGILILFQTILYAQSGDSPSDPIIISHFNETYTGSTTGLTEILPMGPNNHQKSEPNVWYKFTMSNAGYFRADFTPSGGLGKIVLYDQEGIDNWNNNAIDKPILSNYSGTHKATVSIHSESLIPGKEYYLTMFTYYGNCNYTLKISDQYTYGNSYQNPIVLKHTTTEFKGDTKGMLVMKPTGKNVRFQPNPWFKFIAKQSYIRIKFQPSGGIPTMVIYDKEGLDTWESTGEDIPFKIISSGTNGSSVTLSADNLIPGKPYYITVYTYYGHMGYSLNIYDQYDYDYPQGAIELPHMDYWQSAFNAYAIDNITTTPVPPFASCATSKNRWFKFTATSNKITATMIPSGYLYGKFALWSYENNQWIEMKCVSDGSGKGALSIYDQELTIGQTYYLSVTRGGNSQSSFAMQMEGGIKDAWFLSEQNVHPVIEDANVAIGLEQCPQDQSLAVDGDMLTTKAQIALSDAWAWPDYVFDSIYTIPSLSEQENYIQLNHHLPDIPSSDEISSEEGFNAGEINILLLRKIEELTLQTIRLSEKIEMQNQKILQIKKDKTQSAN